MMSRKQNLFEVKDVRDYNNHKVLNAIRHNCLRAVELDDRQGTKKKGSFVLAMAGVADAIYAELGIKPKGKGTATAEPSPELEEKITKLEAIITGQETELDELEADQESKDEKIKILEKELADLKAAGAKKPATPRKKKGAK